MKQRLLICFICILMLIIPCTTIYASDDNTYAGMDTIADDLDPIWDDVIAAGYYAPGNNPLTKDDIDYSRTRKQYDVSASDLFKEERISAESLKEIITNSEYTYFMLLYREHDTLDFIIEKGREPDPELIEKGILTEEEIEYLRKNAGKWKIGGNGVSAYPRNPALDCFGIMDAYLELKGIHNAEIYFIGRINDDASYYDVIFTGRKMDNGEDEILFVAPEQLEYDDEGNLVYSWYDSGIKDFTEAEYTYEELQKIHKETYYIPGPAGGGIRVPIGFWIGLGVLVLALIVLCIVLVVLGKRRKAK